MGPGGHSLPAATEQPGEPLQSPSSAVWIFSGRWQVAGQTLLLEVSVIALRSSEAQV